MRREAPVHSIVYRSPYPRDVFACSPGILALPSGRLVATIDLGGPGMDKIEGPKGIRYNEPVFGKIFISDDHGDSWRFVSDFPFMHARPFYAGGRVYVLGQCMDLMVIASDDDGETWGPAAQLTQGEDWHQAPCNVWHSKGNVYLVMERRPPHDCTAWGVSVIAPVLMRGAEQDDLTLRENWTFATELVFREMVDLNETHLFGMPMYRVPRADAIDVGGGRYCAPWGWLETNVVQITDPKHIWYDETGCTFHLFSRAHTGHTNYACVLKVVEQPDGQMITQFERAPSGERWLYLPWPGGQMKFHMLYDQETKTYWLLSTQATDSAIRPECMPPQRFGLPDNERRRLQLHFSKNCIDWCFAALVDAGDSEQQSRHYASMCIHGKDLYVLSRSGDEWTQSAHNCDMTTFHIIHDFRRLIY